MAQSPAAARDVDISAADGVTLKATYYPANPHASASAQDGAHAAPAVLLLHMCNTTRKSWAPVAEQLSAAGINALTVDYRGFGESGGDVRFDGGTPAQLQKLQAQWPGDLDRVFEWMLSQPGVDKGRIGAGGGSCGVNNAVKLASRHPEVRTLVLLAGGTDPDGVRYLTDHAWLPLFTAAAADDEYDSHAPQLMQWFAEVTGNPRNRFVGFSDGRHGTEIFGPHPELPRQIVEFYRETLVKSPASASQKFAAKKSAAAEFWRVANQPGGGAKAAQMFHDARKRDAGASLFPEAVLNLLGYGRLQAGAKDDAIALLKLNAEAYPASANTQDSLADAYMAAGQNDLALAAEEKCLELLPSDTATENFKAQLRTVAEQKIAKLKAALGK
jgi:dienelactone hydrolase